MSWSVHHINDEKSLSDLDEFLKNNMPSKVSKDSGVDWIAIRNDKSHVEHEVDFVGMLQEWNEIQRKKATIDYWLIRDIARKYNCTSGKWLFYALSGNEVDTAWEKIARGIAEGELGTVVKTAKVSPYAKPDIPKMIGQHVICVYNDDYTNKEQVYLSENLLRKTGIKFNLMYKPDIFTYFEIYAQNPYGMRPTIYNSKLDPKTYLSNITEIYSETRPSPKKVNPITNYFQKMEK